MRNKVTVGDVSGELEVIELLPDYFNPSGRRYQRVRARCSCGHTFDLHGDRISHRRATRCPRCAKRGQRKYNVGDQFGNLTIESFEHDPNGRRMAVCRCSCGGSASVFIGLFSRNKSFNCGCQPLPTYKGVGGLSGAFFYRLKSNAKTRGILFNVSKEELWGLFQKQEGKCALTGLPLTLRERGKIDASVDRINSGLGYVPGNIHWVHKDVNRMKLDLALDRFLALCRAVTEHRDAPKVEVAPAKRARRRKKPGLGVA